MSIASRISEMNDHLLDDYSVLELAGADLTDVDKNIVNLKPTWKERLLHFMNYGTQEVWDNWDKREASITGGSIKGTEEAPMKLTYKGNTYQKTTTGKNLFDKNNITYDMLSIYENTGAGATRIVSSDTSACVYIQISPNSEKFSISGMEKSYNVAALTSVPVDGGGDAVYTWTFRNTQTGNYTTPSLPSSCTYLAVFFTPGDSTIAEVVENLQIEKSDTVTPYEEYTGGPSPNPDYPQKVQVVSGDNSIKVEGQNLMSTNISDYTIGTYAGKYISNDNYVLHLVDNDTSVDVSGCYIGISSTGEVGGSVLWCLNNGSLTRNYQNNYDGTKPYVCFYPANQETLNKIYSRYKVMLAKGEYSSTTLPPYVPYESNSYPISLGVENLLNPNVNKETISGVTFTPIYNDDSTLAYIVANGTATAGLNYYVYGTSSAYYSIPAGTYYLSDSAIGEDNTTYFTYLDVESDGQLFLSTIATKTRTYSTSVNIRVRIVVRNGAVLNNVKFYPMLEKGNTQSPYTPYGKAIELCKIGTYQDKIDKSTGTNLFDKNAVTDSAWLLENGTLSTGHSGYYVTDFIPVTPNTDYYKYYSASARNKYYDKNKQPLNTTTYQDIPIAGNAGTYTTPDNCYYVRMTFLPSTITTLDSFMVNKGTTALPYEPYGTNWYIKKEIGKVILNGSENWNNLSGTYKYYLNLDRNLSNYTQMYSNYFGFNSEGQASLSNGEFTGKGGGGTYLWFRNDSTANTNDFKTWLGTHNTIVYLPLATPTYETITDTTLIGQLEELKKSYEGQTNISQVNNDMPFELDVVALSDGTVSTLGFSLGNPLSSSQPEEEEPQEEPEVDSEESL